MNTTYVGPDDDNIIDVNKKNGDTNNRTMKKHDMIIRTLNKIQLMQQLVKFIKSCTRSLFKPIKKMLKTTYMNFGIKSYSKRKTHVDIFLKNLM